MYTQEQSPVEMRRYIVRVYSLLHLYMSARGHTLKEKLTLHLLTAKESWHYQLLETSLYTCRPECLQTSNAWSFHSRLWLMEAAEKKRLKWELGHRWKSRVYSLLPRLRDHCRRREVGMSLRARGGGMKNNNSKTSTFQMQHYCTNELRAVVGEHTQNWCYPKPDKMPAQKRAEHVRKDKWTLHPWKYARLFHFYFKFWWLSLSL